jgi:TPR repeat protein
LGTCYAKGTGVPQNYAEAAKWVTRAAKQGHALAQCNLGYCYAKGEGVPQDHMEAVVWYRKAAEQGEAPAQFNLGLCYQYGQGVPVDMIEAYKCFHLAAEQRHEGATKQVASLAAAMSPSELKNAEALCREFRDTHPRK